VNTSLVVDDIVMTLETALPEEFYAALPVSIPDSPGLAGTGAGSLSTPGSEDSYFFSLTEPAALSEARNKIAAAISSGPGVRSAGPVSSPLYGEKTP